MGTGGEPRASPQALWQRHFRGVHAWMSSNFRDLSGARDAALALDEWLGGYPQQAGDVMKIALSSAVTARTAAVYDSARAFASVAVDASAFLVLADPEERDVAALAASTLAEAHFESHQASAAAEALQYARSLVERMDEVGALGAWAAAQCDLLDAAMAESLLERRRAESLYRSAYDRFEPLLRNARLGVELRRDWLKVMFGDGQSVAGAEQAGASLVSGLLSGQFVQAALGLARSVAAGSPEDVFMAAADACAEFGVPRDTLVFEVHAALARLEGAARLRAIDALLRRYDAETDRKSQAIVAMLLGLRANTATNPDSQQDLQQASKAAGAAADAAAWATLTADALLEHRLGSGTDGSAAASIFLMARGAAEQAVRGTPRHLPFRAHFERALMLATSQWLAKYQSERSEQTRVYLSNCLEVGRNPLAKTDLPRPDRTPDRLERARAAASDWLGRIAWAVKRRPDALVLIPAATPDGIAFLCVADGTEAEVEVHAAAAEYEAAVSSLTNSMRAAFTPAGGRTDLAKLGRAAFAALPKGVRNLLNDKRTVLLVPDVAAERAAVPYELFHGKKGFLGITHVLARVPSLRAVANLLEPAALPAPASARQALSVAAPDTVPAQPLQFAQPEVDAVRATLLAQSWTVPSLAASQINEKTLLTACELGSFVHIAAHGEVAGGEHAILLPQRRRLGVDAIAAFHGELPATVYLSVCSVGASEYLGGGVSKGIAATLATKGAPAVIASQWPLEDAAAAEFALTFCEAAVKGTVGTALQIARIQALETVSPALWGSMILIGDPWHRLASKGQSEPPDVVARLLEAAVTKGGGVRSAVAAASKERKQAGNPRLIAAIAWAEEAGALFAADPIEVRWTREMAEIAGDLATPVGEMLFRVAESELHKQSGDIEARRVALDRAIDAAARATRRDPSLHGTLQRLLAERQKADLRFEVPEVTTAAGLRINDRNDPAVRLVLELQNAVDRQQMREGGETRVRLPDRSLVDLCWNAVVLGQRNRFLDKFACAAFASQIVARAVRAGWLQPSVERDARRVAGGLLHFLWSTQRMTHLERERALVQSGTLLFALQSLSVDSDGATMTREALLQRGAQVAAEDPSSGARFARARARLRDAAPADDGRSLPQLAARFIADAPVQSSRRAYRAAWTYGYLLELAYELRLSRRPDMADRVLADHAELEHGAQDDLFAWLIEGNRQVQQAPLDPLTAWRYPRAGKNSGSARKRTRAPKRRRRPSAET